MKPAGWFASALLFCVPALVFAFLSHWLAQRQFADIIALSEDPLEDVTSLERVDFVMKGAVVVRNEFAKH